MPSTICTPIKGRLRLAESELFLSVFGFPVSGSFGFFNQMIVPHRAPPDFAIFMRQVQPSVSHVPVGSAASAPSQLAKTSSATARDCRILMSFLRKGLRVLAHYYGQREGRQEAAIRRQAGCNTHSAPCSIG